MGQLIMDANYDWKYKGYVGDRDALEAKSDEELARLEEQLKNRIDWSRNPKDRKILEIELCYVQRELHIRIQRAEFTKNLEGVSND